MALDRHRCTRVASTASWGYSLAHPGAHGSGGRRAVAQASCRPIACRSRLQRGVEVSARLSPRFLSPRSFFLLIQLRHSPFTLRTSFFSSQRLFYCSSALFPVSRSFHFILFFFLSSLRIARYSPAQGLVVGYGVSELVESRFCPLEGAAPCSFSCLFSLLPVT